MSVESDIAELKAAIAGLPSRLAPPATANERRRAQLTASLEQGDWDSITSATATIYQPPDAETGAAWADTEIEITVYDNGFVPEGGLDSGTKIAVARFNGHWYYDGGC